MKQVKLAKRVAHFGNRVDKLWLVVDSHEQAIIEIDDSIVAPIGWAWNGDEGSRPTFYKVEEVIPKPIFDPVVEQPRLPAAPEPVEEPPLVNRVRRFFKRRD